VCSEGQWCMRRCAVWMGGGRVGPATNDVGCMLWHTCVCDTCLSHMCISGGGEWRVAYMAVALCDMTHSFMWHDSFICVACVAIPLWDMTHSSLWYDSSICVTWLIHLHDMTHIYVWHDSFICLACVAIPLCDMTHSSVWLDSFTCATWLIHLCGMTHSSVWHGPFICVTWLIHAYMTHSSMWHDSIVYVAWLIDLCDTTYSCMWDATLIHVTRSMHVSWLWRAKCNVPNAFNDMPNVTCQMYSVMWQDPSMCHDALIYVTWLIHLCDMVHCFMWDDTFIHVTRSTHVS